MAFVSPKDRVLEHSTSNSQTVFTVTGAIDTSYNAFSASMSVGDTTIGGVVEPGTAFKVGLLTYSNANEVTVTTAYDSKGTFSSSGVKEVFMGLASLPAAVRAVAGLAKKNYIVNGGMMVSQENGSTGGSTTAYYPVDQFALQLVNSTGVVTAAQVASPTPGGSPNRFRVTVTTADAAVAASDLYGINQRIEGARIADLKAGTASAKQITIQFGVKAPAGTYCVALRNAGAARSYIAEYTIAGGEANTDVVKSVTLTMDTAGTWVTDNTTGIDLWFGLMCGSTYQTTAGIWTAGNFVGSANQFNFMGTNGNVFELFDVGLYEGSVAPAFQVPDYAQELLICKRYFQLLGSTSTLIIRSDAANAFYRWISFNVPMRATPTCALSSITYGSASNGTIFNPNTEGVEVYALASVTNGYMFFKLSANARL